MTTLAGLLTECRTRADDRRATYRWSDSDLTLYLNEAQEEACWRARLLVDSSVPATDTSAAVDGHAMTRVAVTSGDATYDLDGKIYWVRRVQLGNSHIPLAATDFREMEKLKHGWQYDSGIATRYIINQDSPDNLKLRLYKIPTASATAYLTVVRAPAADMALTTDSPEIASRWHLKLVDWALYRAYNNFNADTYNPELAQQHYATFEKTFGSREQAIAEEALLMKQQANRMLYMDGTF